MAFGSKAKLIPPTEADYFGIREPKTVELPVDMKTLEFQIVNDKLSQIAKLVKSLTYGEMKQYIEEIRQHDEGQMIKPDYTFADILHKWSASKS